jgi:hypothetical protein
MLKAADVSEDCVSFCYLLHAAFFLGLSFHLEDEEACPQGMSVDFRRATLLYIREDRTLRNYRYENQTNSLELSTTRDASVVRPLDSFPAFHGTRRFNNEFTRALHLFLSSARSIQFTSAHPTSPRSILILSTHLCLGLPSGSFPLAFPPETYTRSFSLPFVLHSLPISFSWT